MGDVRLNRVDQGQAKIRNVPIAVTPEGFWCCPSPVVFQKSHKPQNPMNKTKPSSWNVTVQVSDRWGSALASSTLVISDDQQCSIGPQRSLAGTSLVAERVSLAIEFGEPGTCDMKVV